ncbi:pentatricopeptide repeat-containing protein [Senna tora]|uniref:Pentatricopeptide repeat-containing protein n=1 Tax=Senna tora TaxID=362788 RepID=A0A834WBN1_9FABA|nr:pentatricopeptide repeat-containing protein [Senna tora]
MILIALVGPRVVHQFSCRLNIFRKFCDLPLPGDGFENGFDCVEGPLKKMCKLSDVDSITDESFNTNEDESYNQTHFSLRKGFIENARIDAKRVLDILGQDGPELDARLVLDKLHIRPSGLLLREVLFGILENINCENKSKCAKLAYNFFVWCSQHEAYRHTTNSYHLIFKIFAECEEFRAMWRLVDEMIEKGIPATARTFNILICTCGGAGLPRKLMERFIKSKTFNFRPLKHSYNAILHGLLVLNHYKLIEWVYKKMLLEGHSSDILTYNIVMYAKYRLGKVHQFNRLLNEMSSIGLSPDSHTYNILLHILGKGDKPLAALNLLNHMKETGIEPTVLHFTTLIDGLSRAGNLDACKYFFDEMINNGCMPDVVAYTVMITGYVMAGEIEKAQAMFQEMISREQIPNVYTYNSMIRGLCMAGKFDEALSMLKEMETKGCNPNFYVYSTLVNNLRNAGKLADAHKVIRQMMEKGKYAPLVFRLRRHRRR